MNPFSEKPLIFSMQNKSIRPGAIVQCSGQSYATSLQNKMSLWLRNFCNTYYVYAEDAVHPLCCELQATLILL